MRATSNVLGQESKQLLGQRSNFLTVPFRDRSWTAKQLLEEKVEDFKPLSLSGTANELLLDEERKRQERFLGLLELAKLGEKLEGDELWSVAVLQGQRNWA